MKLTLELVESTDGPLYPRHFKNWYYLKLRREGDRPHSHWGFNIPIHRDFNFELVEVLTLVKYAIRYLYGRIPPPEISIDELIPESAWQEYMTPIKSQPENDEPPVCPICEFPMSGSRCTGCGYEKPEEQKPVAIAARNVIEDLIFAGRTLLKYIQDKEPTANFHVMPDALKLGEKWLEDWKPEIESPETGNPETGSGDEGGWGCPSCGVAVGHEHRPGCPHRVVDEACARPRRKMRLWMCAKCKEMWMAEVAYRCGFETCRSPDVYELDSYTTLNELTSRPSESPSGTTSQNPGEVPE